MKINERDAKSLEKFGRYSRKLMRTLREGQEAMWNAGEQFLAKEDGELPDRYKVRLERTILFDALGSTIRVMSGKPFQRPVAVTFNDKYKNHEKLNMLKNKFDSKSRSVDDCGRSVLMDASYNSMAFALSDRREDGEGLPYVTFYSDDSVLEVGVVDGEVTLVRLMESYSKMSNDGLGIVNLQRVRVIRKFNGVVEWALYNQIEEGKDEFINADGWKKHGFDYIPFRAYYANPDYKDDFDCRSPYETLAFLNLNHWRSNSDQEHALHIARIPFLYATGLPSDTKIVMGVDNMMVGPEGSDMKYVEHTGNAIGAGETSIDKIEHRMQSYGLKMLEARGGKETATGQAIQAESSNSILAAMTNSLAKFFEEIYKDMALFLNIDDLEVEVDIHTDFGVSLSAEELTALSTARQIGDLSNENYILEMKRRNVIRPGMDLQTNKDQLDAELHEVA